MRSENFKIHKSIEGIRNDCDWITRTFAESQSSFVPKTITLSDLKDLIDIAFIALHGRPGEDGELQSELEKYKISS